MIGYLEGTVIDMSADQSTILASGVGYDVRHTSDTGLSFKVGKPAQVWIHHVVREDDEQLIGFKTRDERELFRHLLSVNSVGPKTALNILNVCGYETLRKGIASQDPELLIDQGGLGKKTAEKIVFGLKDAFDVEERSVLSGIESEAADALVALGYKLSTVKDALKKIPKEDKSVSVLIKEALKQLS